MTAPRFSTPEAGYMARAKWPWTSAKDGCFDWIEIPSKEETEHG